MKKFLRIFILLVVPLLLTACTKKSTDIATGDSDSGRDSMFSGSIMDFLKVGKAMKCTATYDGEGGKVEMTVYTKGEKAYTESTIEVDSEKIVQKSIVADDMMYSWNDLTKSGTKMSISEMAEMGEDMDTSTDETQQEYYEGLNKEFDYDCTSWTANEAMFNPPSDVEFVDMTAMIKNLQEQVETGDMGGMKDAACAACNMMPTASEKEECLANLGCN